MKKNISINISGIIFHIEEDGYEQLRSYLDTITHYFSSYEDSAEIIADIESRIAEIFLTKLKEGKQVVTLTDVKHLMTTMGSIHDFQAIEGDPIPESDDYYSEEENRHTNQQQPKDTFGVKKLYRDTKRKIIGGVAAGIAHYFRLDPLWIRLIMILLLCDIFITSSVGAFMFIGYIIGWIVIPPNDAVEEDLKTKKLYRNPDDRVISGVCSGLATYFGVDVALIRLLFVLCLFLSFGTFLLIYFILWVITPEAKTITDKMQMQGEPVTLANIENNVKQSLKIGNEEEEGIVAKILLFPFRLISLIFSGLGKAVGPFMLFLVEAIRVISGIIILLISITLLFALFIITGICFNISGYYQLWIPYLSGFPMEILQNSFPPLLFVSAFFTHFIPFFALLLAGISIMVKRRIGNALLGWSLLAIWLVAVAGLGLTLPVAIKDFSREATHRVTETFPIDDEIMVLDLRETGMEGYQATTLQLIGSSGDELELVQKFKARGSSRQNALTNAEMVSYNVYPNDSIITFDSNIRFKEGAVFRVQELDMAFYIPLHKPFIIKESLKPILRNTLHQDGYSSRHMDGNIWMFTEDGLQCQTCPSKEEKKEERQKEKATDYRESTISMDMEGFDNLDIRGALCEIIVTRQDHYSVQLSGDQSLLDNVDISRNGSTLKIVQQNLRRRGTLHNPQLKVVITMPELEVIKLSGVTEAYVEGFEEEHIDIKLSGSNRSIFNINTNDINLAMSGDTKLTLTGKAKYMNVKISGVSRLLAEAFIVENATIKTSGMSNATLNVSHALETSTSGFSKIENTYQKREGKVEHEAVTAFYINNARIFYHAALAKASFWIKGPQPRLF